MQRARRPRTQSRARTGQSFWSRRSRREKRICEATLSCFAHLDLCAETLHSSSLQREQELRHEVAGSKTETAHVQGGEVFLRRQGCKEGRLKKKTGACKASCINSFILEHRLQLSPTTFHSPLHHRSHLICIEFCEFKFRERAGGTIIVGERERHRLHKGQATVCRWLYW